MQLFKKLIASQVKVNVNGSFFFSSVDISVHHTSDGGACAIADCHLGCCRTVLVECLDSHSARCMMRSFLKVQISHNVLSLTPAADDKEGKLPLIFFRRYDRR